MSLSMTVVMHLELIFKTAFKDFKVITGLGLHQITTSKGGWPGCLVGGRVGGLSETGNKAISASIEVEIEVELS